MLAFLLPVSRVGVSVFAPLVIILWFVEGRLAEKTRVIGRSPQILAVLGFVAFNLVSLLWSDRLADGLHYVDKYRYFLLVPVIATSMRPRYVERAVTAFLSGIAVSLVWSYGIAIGVVHVGKGYPENPSPTMLHLDYSIFLALAALVVLNRVVRRDMDRRRRLAWVGFLVFVTLGLFINIGRSGQLAFFVTLLVLLPFYVPGRPWRRVALSSLAVVVVLVSAYTLVPVFEDRVDSAIDEVQDALFEHSYVSNQGKRIAGMIVASDIFRRHPLLGIGVADNMVEFHTLLDDSRYQHLEPALREYEHMHNQYVQVVTELGLVGLLVLLNIFVQLLRLPVANSESRTLVVILCGVYLVGFMGDPFFHKQLPLVLFCLFSGLILSDRHSVWRDL